MNTGKYCNHNVITARKDFSIPDAARLMRQHHVGSLVVVTGNDEFKPVGILTDRDMVIEVLADDVSTSSVTVGDIMTPLPVVANENDDIVSALKIMEQHGVRRLPVTNNEGELVGILTSDDVLKVFYQGLGELVSLYKHEVKHEKQRRR